MSYYFKKYDHDFGDIFDWWKDFMPKEDENIIQDENQWIYEVVKPGLKKEYLKVNLAGDKLILEYKLPEEVKKTRLECDNFSKEWIVKADVKKNDVKVSYKEGILTIAIKSPISSTVESIEIPIE